jgi:hypothetical protein
MGARGGRCARLCTMGDTEATSHLQALDQFSDWPTAARAAQLWLRSPDFPAQIVDLLDARAPVETRVTSR